jgi:hypothetical protein
MLMISVLQPSFLLHLDIDNPQSRSGFKTPFYQPEILGGFLRPSGEGQKHIRALNGALATGCYALCLCGKKPLQT